MDGFVHARHSRPRLDHGVSTACRGQSESDRHVIADGVLGLSGFGTLCVDQNTSASNLVSRVARCPD